MQERRLVAAPKDPTADVCAPAADGSLSQTLWLGLPIAALALGFATAAFAESHETIIVSHGYNEYDTLKYSPDDAHLAYVNPDAPVGGELSFATVGTFDSMNPYATGIGTPGVLSSYMYQDMMISTADEVGSSYCLLCTTLEYPESQDWVIFNIRDDVTFSDGTPMTAEDILFSFNLLREQGTPSYAQFVQANVETVEVLDPYRLKFTFKDGVPRLGLISTMGSLPAFPKHWYEETGARLDKSRLETGPGTGEYAIDSIDVGRQIVLKRNPDYWGTDVPFRKGTHNIDEVRLEFFG
ncbi:MAG: ABC transporter substrate-binding protein, partial [Pseudomonadota bacterium]